MKQTLATILAITLLTSAALQAKKSPEPVSVTTQSYQLVVKKTKDKKGKIKKVKKWVKASKVVPGTIVKYVDTVTNNTDAAMNNVAIKNPINPHLIYMAKTARCQTECGVLYSVDGGKHFDVPARLFVGKGKKRHLAQPKEYNAIQWTIVSVPAKSNVTVEFKAKLK
jgi:uncharacterized repeat protein (TIGR01451 family)